MADIKSKPAAAMPEEMTIRAVTYPGDRNVWLILEAQDRSWCTSSCGATLDNAAHILFRRIHDAGGIPKFRQDTEDAARSMGFLPT